MTERQIPCQLWPSGKLVDLADLQPEDIDIRDIARGLSSLPRFGGLTTIFYPVACHCLAAASILEAAGFGPRTILRGLLHDAEEAYFGDIKRPIKGAMMDVNARYTMSDARRRIFTRFGAVSPNVHADTLIKAVDNWLLFEERNALQPGVGGRDWAGEDEALLHWVAVAAGVRPTPASHGRIPAKLRGHMVGMDWASPESAEAEFLRAFHHFRALIVEGEA